MNNASTEQQVQAVTDIMCWRWLKSKRCIFSFSMAILLPFFFLFEENKSRHCRPAKETGIVMAKIPFLFFLPHLPPSSFCSHSPSQKSLKKLYKKSNWTKDLSCQTISITSSIVFGIYSEEFESIKNLWVSMYWTFTGLKNLKFLIVLCQHFSSLILFQ